MTIPAIPINEAALRYSPEIADAFQPTLTLRPATPVVNYKSDERTRRFFKRHIGPHFPFTYHLNRYVRDYFSDARNKGQRRPSL